MIVENQWVFLRWTNSNRDHFIKKGYKYTKNRDGFWVKACDLMNSSKIKVDVKCDYCGAIIEKEYGNYIIEINKDVHKCACSHCQGRKLSDSRSIKQQEVAYKNFIELCRLNNFLAVSSQNDYQNRSSKLKFICKIHGLQESTVNNIKKHGCPQCKKESKAMNKSSEKINEFIELCKSRGYTALCTHTEYINTTSPLKYMCPIHGEQYISLSNLRAGKGCPKCKYKNISNALRMNTAVLIDTIQFKNNNLLLNPHEYKTSITNNLEIKCGSCGDIFKVSLNNYHKNITGKCPNCNGKSLGEYFIRIFLDKYNINYMREKRFPDCKDKRTLPFDFYLPDYNTCIEFDGQQHFEPKFGQKSFEKTQKHDKMKNKYCNEKNIKLIRIPYWEGHKINEILTQKLDLTKENKIA